MYVGEYCQYMNPCHTGPGPRCQNGGSCNVRSSPTSSPTFWCTCPIGYSASLCEIPVANSCDSDPCLNGGTCTLRSLDSYSCTCAPGYTGQHCELQDHCASTPCRNGAECESQGDTYKCSCAPGFVGPSCAEDIVECKEDPCQHGTCFNTHGSYKWVASCLVHVQYLTDENSFDLDGVIRVRISHIPLWMKHTGPVRNASCLCICHCPMVATC